MVEEIFDEQKRNPEETADKKPILTKENFKNLFSKISSHPDIFLITALIIFCVIIRLMPTDLSSMDNIANRQVTDNIKDQIFSQVKQDHPQLSTELQLKETEQRFNEYSKELNFKEEFNAEVSRLSEEFKQRFKDGNGQIYLFEIDPYFWLRHAKNILKYGYAGDKLVNGTSYDSLTLAPNGRVQPRNNLHSYVIAGLYKITGFFGVSLETTSFYTPILLIILCIFPAFYLTKKLTDSSFCASVTTFLIITDVSLFSRTFAGFSDTDAYEVLFPLLIVWALMLSYDKDKLWKNIMFASLAGLLTGLFAYAWIGWGFVFDLICGMLGIYFLYLLFTKRVIKRHLSISISYVITSLLFVLLFRGPKNLVEGPLSPIWFNRFLTDAGFRGIWPNVSASISEQISVTLNGLITALNGWFFIILAITGLVFIFIYSKKHFILFVLWVLVTGYASTKGFRYVLLLSPIIAILVGCGINSLMNKLEGSEYYNKWVLFLLVSCLLFIPFKGVLDYGDNPPVVDDAYVDLLNNIKEGTPEDAIITSWWDFGHYYKYFAERRVTFDGTTQHNNGLIHWVGRLLFTDDEHETMGILRMLDCGGGQNTAEMIFKNMNEPDEVSAVYLLKEIILLDKQEAKERLAKEISDVNVVLEVLNQTHCTPPEAILITGGDIIQKSPVLTYFGNWDFAKAKNKEFPDIHEYTKNNAAVQSQECINGACPVLTEKGYIYIGADFRNKTISGINVDSIIYEENRTIHEKELNHSTNLSMVMVEPFITGIPNNIINSVFIKLFYFNATGLEHFEVFDKQTSVTGQRLIAWRVKW